MKNMILLLSLILIAGATTLIDPYTHWLEAVEAYNQTYHREKVYMNTDKTLYLPGETIWFSGFILNALDHTVSGQSDVLYVDILAPNGALAETLVLPATAGLARGSWEIRDEMPGGQYTLRAYTRWMKNFDQSDYFERRIPVQKATLSRLLMKLDYARDGYGPGDSVVAILDLRDLNDRVIPSAGLNYEVRISGSKALRGTASTDEGGQARLRFILPETLSTADGILEIAIRHAGIFETITRSIPIRLDRVDLRFFPEGGTWAVGASQRIGFKAMDSFGKGADISGEIRDKDGNVITTFSSLHQGIGSFDITAGENETYRAFILSDGKAQEVSLPDPENDAYQLRINQSDRHSVTFDVTVPYSDSLMLVGRSFGRVEAIRKTWLPAGTHRMSLPLENFSSGVAVFTLFDNLGLPVCERLWFVRNNDLLNVEITSDKEKYLPGEEVKLSVRTKVNGRAVPAQLSLRVADEALLEMVDDKQDHLLSYMLLSSEIRGTIEEPVYYFDTTKTDRETALDNLLLTQGWRRYNWKELDRKRSLPHSPEKITRISGKLKRYGKKATGKIRLIELNEDRRILEVETKEDGSFAFENIDPGSMYLLATDAQYQINVDQHDRLRPLTRRTEVAFAPADNDLEDFSVSVNEVIPEEEPDVVMNMTMESDVTQLSEVVVTGYGMQQTAELTGSVVNIQNDELSISNSLDRTLQGRAAGVRITQNNPVNTPIRIRGNSITGQTGPLVIIDGIPYGPATSGNLSALTDLHTTNINTVSVISGARASAIYGSTAAEGVIFITTRSGLPHGHRPNVKRERFSTTVLNPYQFSAVKEFYQPPVTPKEDARTNFSTTLYWDPVVITDDEGHASVTFHTNDALTLYKVTAEGFSASGNLGIGVHRIRSYMPVAAEARIPEFLGLEDTLRLPVRLQNMTSEIQTATISITFPDTALWLNKTATREVKVGPGMEESVYFELATRRRTGTIPLDVTIQSGSSHDVIRGMLTIRPMGIPRHRSYASTRTDTTFVLPPRSVEGNTHRLRLDIYANLLADLFAGAKSLLREPHGCFEQVSATTFPNVLALQYMKATNTLDPAISAKAHDYLEKGFRKLKAYEIRGGGFEWFGHPPAHEGLTAFGLIEFYEMNRVHPLSDPEIIERTRQWLLNRRNGQGGFNQARGKYGFSGAKEEVTNAYIVYALSATETGEDILPEYEHAVREAWASRDMYRLALMANAAHYLQRDRDYERLIGWFRFVTGEKGYQGWQADHSIVRSDGPSLDTETLAFWTLALLHRAENMNEARENIDQLLKKRHNARFGNSQATTVSLMALTRFARLTTEMQSDGQVVVSVNGREVRQVPYSPRDNQTISVGGFENFLDPSVENTVRVRIETRGKPVPVALQRAWSTLRPDELEQSKVGLTTRLTADTVDERRSVRLEVVVKNQQKEPLPMSLARVNIPAGLELQVWQLLELQEDGVFDYYEIVENELYLYFRELARASELTVPLDLKATLPGRFRAGASSAYLYYSDEVKTWVNGEEVIVKPSGSK